MKLINKCLTAVIIFSVTVSQVIPVFAKEKTTVSSAPYINAYYAAAIDGLSHRVLYDKNANYITPMASTTKIVTALVALNYGNIDEKVTISHRAANIHGSQVGYKENESVTIRELIYGLMLRSGNDAAIALAESRGGTVEEFLNVMNEYAVEIGLTNTHFESPHGLDSDNHYTTAYDLALAASKAKENEEFSQIVEVKEIPRQQFCFSRDYRNINKILWLLPEASGIKTGYTGKAGKCLVTSVKTPGKDMIITLINSPTRWKETCKIYKYVNENYEYKNFHPANSEVKNYKYKRKSYVLKTSEEIILPIKNGSNVTERLVLPQKLAPKMNKNFGLLQFYENNELIYCSPLKCERIK
ncbi:D-alanyl-D-alanine carboxypeptidase family protein [Clostridium oryzae]|uniref:D-alanyl-D-alanine carboxypeptidase DacB n=1 Tax=Clostridium oryzae TaxID=1450648 RepID=A0A1V4IT46_9CLOT|nr:D-alanyl-D-alanine carboxypeptidase family protein [Clostridium oryzae]OPJ63182.1 D-alanyl-D-alanine carboxypeptidase DacB precursor [Clostridium oryzae]